MGKNVKPLAGVQATADVIFSSDLKGESVEVQPVIVKATLDKTGRKDKQDYKGYMMLFTSINKVIPINAGDILALQIRTGQRLFEDTPEGLLLTHESFGFENGKLIAE